MMHKNQAFRIMLDRFEESQGNFLDTSPLTKLSVDDLGNSAFMLKLLREFLEIEILDFIEEPAKSDVIFFETCIQEDRHGLGWKNCLKYASNSVKSDKLFFLRLIEEFGYYQSLAFADETVRLDSEIADAVFELLPEDLNAVKYCSLSVRSKHTLIKNAVSYNGLNLEFASDELKLDKTIVNEAILNNPEAFKYASEILRNDQELALSAVKSDFKTAKFIGQSLMNSGKFINELIEEVELINRDLFSYIPEKFKSNKQILKRILHKLENFISIDDIRDFIDEDDREFFLEAIKENGTTLRYAGEKLRDDKTIVSLAMQTNIDAFKYASERLSNDPELATMAVEAWPAMLKRVGRHAQDNNQVVLAAVLRQGTALDWASDRLRDDKEIVSVALSEDPYALEYASTRLRNDRGLVFAACKTNIHAYIYAGKTLFSDKDFAMLVAPQVPNCLEHFSQELANDPDVLAVYINEQAPWERD